MGSFRHELSLFMFKIGAVSLVTGIFSSVILMGTSAYYEGNTLFVTGIGLTAFFWITGFILRPSYKVTDEKTDVARS